MADLSSLPGVKIEYFDVTYTVHLSNGETKVFTIKTYPCPRCSAPMLVGPISYPGTGDTAIVSYRCPNDGTENVRIEAKE